MPSRTERNKEKQVEIETEEKREKRKKLVLLSLKIIGLFIIFMSLFYLYTSYCATRGLIVKEERIKQAKIPENFNGCKIIQISDIHYGTTIFQEEMKNLVKTINKRKPDLVFFTGDLIDKDYKLSSKKQEQLTKYLQQIDASIGKYAVLGEEDEEQAITILNQSDFTILKNNYDLVYKNTTTPILIVGLGSLLKNERDIEEGYKYFKEESHNANIYTITLLHEAEDIKEINSKYQSDLYLGGHSHNGQIRIPKVGSPIKKDGSKQFDQPYYELDDSKIYISSGIGTNQNGIRLFCRPSINFFRLSSK